MTTSPSSDGTRQLDEPRFDCPHCGVLSNQSWGNLLQGWSPYSSTGFSYLESRTIKVAGRPDNEESRWRCAQCGACGLWSLWRDEVMVYPVLDRVGRPAHEDMPPQVRELYEDAAKVAAVSRRGGTALARATVERLIKIIDSEAPADAKLDRRIDRIRARVSSPLGDMLEVVRYVGNKMLHVEDRTNDLVVMVLDDQDGPAMVELLLETANDLVDELIAKPKSVASLRDRLPQNVRDKIVNADPRDSGVMNN